MTKILFLNYNIFGPIWTLIHIGLIYKKQVDINLKPCYNVYIKKKGAIDLDFYLYEKDIILILNCINYTMLKLDYHPSMEQKKELEFYFSFNNYNEHFESLKLLHRRISTKANKELYNLNNDIFFVGQKRFLCECNKDLKFFKNKKYNRKISFFNFFIDKINKIV